MKQSPHEICHCIETAKYNISNPSTLFKPYLLLHHFLLPLQPLRSPPPTTQALHHPPDRTEPPIRQDGLGARESSVLAGHFLPLPPPSPSAPPSRHHPTTILLTCLQHPPPRLATPRSPPLPIDVPPLALPLRSAVISLVPTIFKLVISPESRRSWRRKWNGVKQLCSRGSISLG